jgi:hypothetical protein
VVARGKKVAILQSSESGVTGCLAIVTGQPVPGSLIDIVVEQNAHLRTRDCSGGMVAISEGSAQPGVREVARGFGGGLRCVAARTR